MKVLIVDDSIDLLEVMHEWLKAQHQVICAKDGIEALGHLRGEEFDFLITDYRMPRLDGVGLIEKIGKEKLAVKNILLISSDLPEVSILSRLQLIAEGCFKFFSAEKNQDGFDFIKRI